ncbi:Amino acid synthesis [Ruegeria halocynthiae]|uniref:Amino acid synthesis n=1 Tax=Ruegeria halocynthiae TaxID=985054 RepID=A0A1H2WN68_9RHOB|nr:amino acid synthesis family protein [Ruegeria halocynthiae]SDW81948.1 Amino acid synthesis [Ruegeria halocynthiae]
MVQLRKKVFIKEVVATDQLGKSCAPVCRVAALAVIQNPLSGKFSEDLSELFEIGGTLGAELAAEAVSQLDGIPISYGKSAIVGLNGDLEQGGALIHPKLGAPMRAAAGGGEAVIPSNAKLGTPGCAIDLPLGHKDNPWSFDHFDTMTLSIPDAPKPDEIVLCLAYADGGRPIPRCGTGPVKN